MWRDNREISVRRMFAHQAKQKNRFALNKMNVRVGAQAAMIRRTTLWTVIPIAVVLGLLMLGYAGKAFARMLYSDHGAFTITRLEIQTGPVVSEDLIREYLQVGEGMNLFEVNIRELRKNFIRNIPNVKNMDITRLLPGTLKIMVTERSPRARLGAGGHLVADEEGCVFVLGGRVPDLPYITGLETGRLAPGDRLSGMALAAVEVLDACEHPAIGLPVARVDARYPDHVRVYLTDGKFARLAWEGMGENSASFQKKLFSKLKDWVNVLNTDRGRKGREFDLTLNDETLRSFQKSTSAL